MGEDRRQRIRERAFALWEDEGKPEGLHEDHWKQASDEIDAQQITENTVKSRPSKVKQEAGGGTTKRRSSVKKDPAMVVDPPVATTSKRKPRKA
jgi:hypothetical protein